MTTRRLKPVAADAMAEAMALARLRRERERLKVVQAVALKNALACPNGRDWRVPGRDPGFPGLAWLGLIEHPPVPGALGRLTAKGRRLRELLLAEPPAG